MTPSSTVSAPRPEIGDAGARPQTTSDEVYEKLRLAIVTGEDPAKYAAYRTRPGNSLNVSRTPIRESLQRLGADDLIVPRKRGWAVKEYSPEEIQESYEVRVAVEGFAARLAAQRASDEEIEAIAEIQRLRRWSQPDARVPGPHEPSFPRRDHQGGAKRPPVGCNLPDGEVLF